MRTENTLKMTTPQAAAHWNQREGKQKESVGAREAHRRGGFVKVQVQDLRDCQAALSFWFHINAVSFLPPPSPPSPAPLLTSVDLLFFECSPHTREKSNKNTQPCSHPAYFFFFQILRFVLQSSTMERKPGKTRPRPDYWRLRDRAIQPIYRILSVREAQTSCYFQNIWTERTR